MTFKPWVYTTAKLVKRAFISIALGLALALAFFFFYNLDRNVKTIVNREPVIITVLPTVEPTATPSATPVRIFRPVSPVPTK